MTTRVYAIRMVPLLLFEKESTKADKKRFFTARSLTENHNEDKIDLTHRATMPSGAPHVQKRRTKRQDPSSQTPWHASSSSGAGKGRVVLAARLFRPARRPAGQVRNATQSAYRRMDRQPCCPTSGFFETHFLRSPSGVRRCGIGWAVTGQKGTTPRPQANRHRDGLYPTADRTTTRDRHGRNRRQRVRALCCASACEKHQSGSCRARKKNAIDPLYNDEKKGALALKYEQLREAVRAGTAKGRIGLSVLLSQGMWAWVHLVANEISTPKQAEHTACKALPIQNDQSSASGALLLGVWTDLLLGRLAVQEEI